MALIKTFFTLLTLVKFSSARILENPLCGENLNNAIGIYCNACDGFTSTANCYFEFEKYSIPTILTETQCRIESNGYKGINSKHCTKFTFFRDDQELTFEYFHKYFYGNDTICLEEFKKKGSKISLCFGKGAKNKIIMWVIIVISIVALFLPIVYIYIN